MGVVMVCEFLKVNNLPFSESLESLLKMNKHQLTQLQAVMYSVIVSVCRCITQVDNFNNS